VWGKVIPHPPPLPATPPARHLLVPRAIRNIEKLKRHAVETTINRLLLITDLLIVVDLVSCSYHEQCPKKDRELRETVLEDVGSVLTGREYVESLSRAPHRRPLLCQNILRHCLHRI
jgi:hypothetical protein